MTPENTELLAQYVGHLQRSPLTGHSPRTYLGAIRAYLVWLEQAPADGDPLNDATAKDWAVRDYRSYLVAVAKRATARISSLCGPPPSVTAGSAASIRARRFALRTSDGQRY